MRTRKDELALEIYAHLDRKLSEETKRKLSSSDTREIILTISEYVLIENFNTIFDHLHKFQTALLESNDSSCEEESDFMNELKKI
jgi:hypothetical protein